jgi:hypothetical protein
MPDALGWALWRRHLTHAAGAVRPALGVGHGARPFPAKRLVAGGARLHMRHVGPALDVRGGATEIGIALPHAQQGMSMEAYFPIPGFALLHYPRGTRKAQVTARSASLL